MLSQAFRLSLLPLLPTLPLQQGAMLGGLPSRRVLLPQLLPLRSLPGSTLLQGDAQPAVRRKGECWSLLRCWLMSQARRAS